MNNKKRILLKTAVGFLEKAEEIVERVSDDEQDCLDNMPENLQSSEKYERMEDVIDNLDVVMGHIDNAKDYINEASG